MLKYTQNPLMFTSTSQLGLFMKYRFKTSIG